MIFAQGYVKELLFSWVLICAVWGWSVCFILRFDQPDWVLEKEEYRIWGYVSVINAELLCGMKQTGWNILFWSILAGCLILACITDYKSCEVYQFTWWIAGFATLLLMWKDLREGNRLSFSLTILLLVYVLLQEYFFCKFYGKADSHAFVVCAGALFGLGMNFRDCLLHMLLAFGGLAVVQLFRGNINRRGNLKKPVAFLPYITISFWIKCGCFCLEKMVY